MLIMSIISEEAKNFHKNQFNFHTMLVDNKKLLISFVFYIYKIFDLSSYEKRKKRVFECIRRIKKERSDFPIYMFLNTEMVKMGRTSSRELEASGYEQNIHKKIDSLIKILPANAIPNIVDLPALDIGTERLQYLDILEETLKVRAFGINISAGFCHYDESFATNEQDKRFSFYDGIHINFPDNSFSLITMLSVIHHIPDENFVQLAKEIVRVLRPGGYLFIKDVDLKTPTNIASFRVQHHLYADGFLIEGERSYFNETVTFEKTMSALIRSSNSNEQNNQLTLVSVDYQQNFNGTYFALFTKN